MKRDIYKLFKKSKTLFYKNGVLVAVFFLILGLNNTYAQITYVNPNITPSFGVTDVLLGAGVTATNITYNGNAAQANNQHNAVRHFTNTSGVFPFVEGVLLQTNGAPNINDADLSAITTNTVTNGVVIEFDFVPDGDSLSFSYIFASSEYTSYTCNVFNDVFGFFISGPGINGPYSNNSQNLAVVPGSNNIPVGINTVNSGSSSSGSSSNCNNADPNWQQNSVYFTTSYNSVYSSSSGVENYNGSTVELTANATVICGETYRIKLAISNVGDQSYHSGVFLKAGSFSSEPTTEIIASNNTSLFLDSLLIEGCDEGSFCFKRSASESANMSVIHYELSGTATYGDDYIITNLPNQGDSVVLNPGETEFCLLVEPLEDGFFESNESVILTTYTVNGCGDTLYTEGVLWIADRPGELMPDAGSDISFCEGDSGVLNGTPTNPANSTEWTYSGSGNVVFSPNSQDPNAEVTFSEYGVYTFYFTEFNDTCALQETDTIVVTYGQVGITTSNDVIICQGEEIELVATAQGNGNFTYFWDHTNNNDSVQIVSPQQTTTYTVYADSDEGCSSTTETITVEVQVPPQVIFSVIESDLCTPATFELINHTDTTDLDEVFWYISDGQTFNQMDSLTVVIENPGTYSVKVVAVTTNGCIDSTTVNGMLTVYPKPTADFTHIPHPVRMLNTTVQFQNYTINANEYEWHFQNGTPLSSNVKDPISKFPEGETGNYEIQLIATSEIGCKDTIVKILTVLPEVLIFAPNSFTPDGDDYNAVWKPIMEGVNPLNVTIEIYNRWGEIIWESHDQNVGWDGTYGVDSDRKVKSGTYVWKIKASDIVTDEKYEWNGFVNVLY